jgi:hypothetical protein
MPLNIALQLGIVGLGSSRGARSARARIRPHAARLGGGSARGHRPRAPRGFLAKNLTDDFLHRHNAQVFWALNGMLVGFGRRARG